MPGGVKIFQYKDFWEKQRRLNISGDIIAERIIEKDVTSGTYHFKRWELGLWRATKKRV